MAHPTANPRKLIRTLIISAVRIVGKHSSDGFVPVCSRHDQLSATRL